MISKHIEKTSDLANELQRLMHNSLSNKTAQDAVLDNDVNNIIADLSRSAEIFDELENHKAAEIITKIIEKLASNNGK